MFLKCLFIFVYLFGYTESYLWHVGSFKLKHAGSTSLTRDETWAPALGAQSLNCWTTRKVPAVYFFFTSECHHIRDAVGN